MIKMGLIKEREITIKQASKWVDEKRMSVDLFEELFIEVDSEGLKNIPTTSLQDILNK